MNVYILNGKKAIVHEGELFVEADSLGTVGPVHPGGLPVGMVVPLRKKAQKRLDKLTKPKRGEKAASVGRSDKSKRLDPETKQALIDDLEAGDLTVNELSEKYQMTVSGIHYVKKKAGLGATASPKKSKKDDREGFIKKNFQCACGKAFSASVTGEPGEMISCADPECGEQMLASEGEEI